MKRVYLVHGFLAGDLLIRETGKLLWWDPSLAMLLGISALKLAPNGIDPSPDGGEEMIVAVDGQAPWPIIRFFLRNQLDPSLWSIELFNWDWRKEIQSAATTLAATVFAENTPTNPATLVGHSAGGLVCVLAYAKLVASGRGNLVRRIITICTPFQGSYLPIMFMNGLGESISQLLNIGQTPVAQLVDGGLGYTVVFLSNVALTWPVFYQVFPALGVPDASFDPDRVQLYTASNYPNGYKPSQDWLDNTKNTFQPALRDPNTFPPAHVFTCIYGTGCTTPDSIRASGKPINLGALTYVDEGDGVVTKSSQIRNGGKTIGFPGGHSSLPGGLAVNGVLAKEIREERNPPDPAPPPFLGTIPIGISITSPPESDPTDGMTCLSGG